MAGQTWPIGWDVLKKTAGCGNCGMDVFESNSARNKIELVVNQRAFLVQRKELSAMVGVCCLHLKAGCARCGDRGMFGRVKALRIFYENVFANRKTRNKGDRPYHLDPSVRERIESFEKMTCNK